MRKQWIQATIFPPAWPGYEANPTGDITSDQWVDITAEDVTHPYELNPLSLSDPPLDLPGDQGNEGSEPYDRSGSGSVSPLLPVNPEQYQFPEL